jgi:hypothetical protein
MRGHAPLLYESGQGVCVRGLDGEVFDLSQARHSIYQGSSRRQPWSSWISPGSPSSGRQVPGDGAGILGLGTGAPGPSPEATGSTLPDTDPAIWREHEEIVLGGGVPPHDMDILAVACPRMMWTFYFQAVACPRMIWIFYFQAAACPRTV